MIRLLQKDNRVVKTMFAIIIGAACLSMVVYLVPGLYDGLYGSNSEVFATVRQPGWKGRLFGDSIEVTNKDISRLTQRLMQTQGYPAFYQPYVERQAQQLEIAWAAERQEAERLGLTVTDADVRAYLHEGQLGQILFPNGQFIGQDKYREFVQNQPQLQYPTTAEFERQIKEDVERQRLREFVTAGVTVSDNQVREEYRQQGTKVKIDYVTISPDSVAKDIAPTDSELRSFFDRNKARYEHAVPETRKISYVVVSQDAYPGGRPQVTDADLQAYYNAHKNEFKVEDQVKVRHILISVPQGADAKTDAAARAKAEDLLKKIKAGGDFAALAKANSDDPGSKASGGELGWVKKNGQMVPEFENAAMALAKGQVSGLVKTQFGYHIIQATDRQTAHTKSFDEVKDEIRPRVVQEKAGKVQAQFAQTLQAEAQKSGMEKTAAAHHLQVQTTDYLPESGTINGVTDSSAITAAAFQAKKGEIKTVTNPEGLALVQVVDIKPAHAPTFEEWKNNIANDYKQEQIPQMLMQRLNKVTELAKQTGSLKTAAAQLKLDVKTSDMVGKDGNVPELGLMSGPGAVAFTLPKGGVSDPITAGRNGAVLQVIDKQEPSAEEIAQNFEKTREALLGKKKDEVFGAYMGTVLDNYNKGGGIRYTKPQKKGNPLGM
ncbi:MAG: peptidylprolyl isomerase [Acidobacteria bacterium]|nr:peptidylprolyl isomerase [Acidobacteriota bacterium]